MKRLPSTSRILTADNITFVASPIVVLVLWELAAQIQLVDTRFFSSPSQIAAQFVELISSGELFEHLIASVRRVTLGFLLGVVPGTLIGAVMGFSRFFRMALLPLATAAFPIPKIAILPLVLIIFGTGELSSIVLVAIGVFFIALFNSMGGVINLPARYLEVGQTFGLSNVQYIRMIALPGALPAIFTGLKVSSGIALLLIVAAEFVGTQVGIGYLIWSSWQIFQVDTMFVGLIILSILGYLVNFSMEKMEGWALPWR